MIQVNETNAKSHNQNYPMNPEVLSELIKDMLNPGSLPLGIPFAWSQPNEGETVQLGSIYSTSPNVQTWGEVIDSYPSSNSFSIIRMIRELYKSVSPDEFRKEVLTKKIDFSLAIYECENISILWDSLNSEEKSLYRLCILNLNTMTEGHNFACEYLELLAYNHYSQFGYSSSNEKGFRLYENGGYHDNSDDIELLGNILNKFENHMSFYIQDSGFNSSYYEKKFTQLTSETIQDYLDNKESLYHDTYLESDDLIFSIFGEDVINRYDRKLILSYLGYSMTFIYNQYLSGNFFFTSIPDYLPHQTELYKFLFTYFNQPVLF